MSMLPHRHRAAIISYRKFRGSLLVGAAAPSPVRRASRVVKPRLRRVCCAPLGLYFQRIVFALRVCGFAVLFLRLSAVCRKRRGKPALKTPLKRRRFQNAPPLFVGFFDIQNMIGVTERDGQRP